MVVFLDLEDDVEPPEQSNHWSMYHSNMGGMRSFGGDGHHQEAEKGEGRENPNREMGITKALGCYPVITAIASSIDLNTLDALSSSCRQIRANLLQYRSHLITSTLHCENEEIAPDPEHTFRYRARAADWYFVEGGRESLGSGAGKFGDCARDLVGGCRRCGRVVCRNCTIKSPAPVLLRHRHRRICTACSRVPLSSLIGPSYDSTLLSPDTLKSEICHCPSEGVWLCQPCGRSLRNADNEYEGIWKWRTRYLQHTGGLGVGIGEGNRGVQCGRGEECVAAREVENEIDCDAEDAKEIDSNSRAASPSSSPGSSHSSVTGTATPRMGTGYARHEIEGIGGVMKKKLVKMVKVGACVPEFADELSVGKYLVREQEGKARSWCGWCWRVVPGVKDVIE